MGPINKYEAAGIFLSVAVMALALALVRFESGRFFTASDSAPQQGAVVAVSEDGGEQRALADALLGSVSTDGELRDLIIDDVRIGTGSSVVEGDTVTVHYIGTTQDGVKFDSSYDRGETFTFTVGKSRVIEGWQKGLVGMQAGGQRILVIPSEMAYGDRQVGPIPPNSVLVFAIELLEIE